MEIVDDDDDNYIKDDDYDDTATNTNDKDDDFDDDDDDDDSENLLQIFITCYRMQEPVEKFFINLVIYLTINLLKHIKLFLAKTTGRKQTLYKRYLENVNRTLTFRNNISGDYITTTLTIADNNGHRTNMNSSYLSNKS